MCFENDVTSRARDREFLKLRLNVLVSCGVLESLPRNHLANGITDALEMQRLEHFRMFCVVNEAQHEADQQEDQPLQHPRKMKTLSDE